MAALATNETRKTLDPGSDPGHSCYRRAPGLPSTDFGASAGVKDRLVSTYNPYPPGILPSGLSSEIARVLREMDVIEGRALARWHGLEPPTLAGQPPMLQNAGTEATETLGELTLYDKNISPNQNKHARLATCPMPASVPIPSVNLTMIGCPAKAPYSCRQAHSTATPLFSVLPCAPIQPGTGSVFRRKLLGFACDRIQATDSRRRTGPGPSR